VLGAWPCRRSELGKIASPNASAVGHGEIRGSRGFGLQFAPPGEEAGLRPRSPKRPRLRSVARAVEFGEHDHEKIPLSTQGWNRYLLVSVAAGVFPME
jgi:hypothetical protein